MSASPPSPSFRDYLPEDGNGSESALRRTQQIANPPPAGFGSVRDNGNSNKNSMMNSAMKSSPTRPREERKREEPRQKKKKKRRRVTWKEAGKLAHSSLGGESWWSKAPSYSAMLRTVLLIILPISLGLLFNHYKDSILAQELLLHPYRFFSHHGRYYSQEVVDYVRETLSIDKQRSEVLSGEAASKEGVIHALLPEFLVPSIMAAYNGGLSSSLKTLYNKTIQFDTVSLEEWHDAVKEDFKKHSMGRYDMYPLLSTWIPTFAEQSYLADVTEYLQNLDSSYWEDVFPQIRENVATYDNKIYALPADGDVLMMMYNKGILDRYGLDPPETWQEWVEVSEQLHGKDLNGDGKPDAGSCVVTKTNGFWAPYFFAFIAPFLQTFGSDQGIFFDPNDMTPNFAASNFTYVLDLFKEMIDSSIHDIVGQISYEEANEMFLEERCALLYNFHGTLKTILTQLHTEEEKSKFKLGMIPGTKVILSMADDSLEECDEQLCPYANEHNVNRAPFYGEGGIGFGFSGHTKPDILKAATHFAVSLTGPEHSLPLVASVGSLLEPYRYSHFNNIDDPESEEVKIYGENGWSHEQIIDWKNNTMFAFEHQNGAKDLTMYGKALYVGENYFESILHSFLEEKTGSEGTRVKLERAWDTLTARFGRGTQQKLYRKSLGLPKSPIEIPFFIMGVALLSITALLVLTLKNRQLSKKLAMEKASLQKFTKLSTLVSNNPASRLIKVLRDIQKGKKPDTEVVDCILTMLRTKGPEFWKPDLSNNKEFKKVEEENKAFADYLQYNLMSNFFDSAMGSRSTSGLKSKSQSPSSHRHFSGSSGSMKSMSDILKSSSAKTNLENSRNLRQLYQNEVPFSRSLNDVDQLLLKDDDKWHPLDKIKKLDNIGDWNISPFHVSNITNGHPILTIVYNIFGRDLKIGEYHSSLLLSDLNISQEKFWKYVQAIESQMNPENIYHNAIHVADVTHNMLWLLTKGEMAERLQMSELEVFAAIFAAMIHDFDHPGVSNDFLVRTSDRRAILYNNQSVNENWHVAQAFGLLHRDDPELQWDEHWSEERSFKFRKLCISMVLATDMSRHFELLGKFKTKLRLSQECMEEYAPFDPTESKSKESVLVMAIKIADIGAQGKVWSLARKWATIVQEEFFAQGDTEKELGMLPSPLCDRESVDILKSQIGFIDAVLFPLFEPVSKVLPEMRQVLTQLESNKHEYEKELKERNDQRKSQSF